MIGGNDRPTGVEWVRRWWTALCGWPGALAILAGVVATAAVAWSGLADGVSLGSGATVGGGAGIATGLIVAGVIGRPRRWWLTRGLPIASLSTAIAFGARWWLHDTGLVAEHYPPSFLLWTGLALCAVGVAVTGSWRGPVAVRVARILAAPVAVLAAFLLINDHYGYWPTVGALMDHPIQGQVSAAAVRHGLDHPPTRAIEADRLIPIRARGVYAPVAIPAAPVPFAAAPAWVWLPPAYYQTPRPQLPVMVMLTGLPGQASDWAVTGEAVPVANHWARTHGGVAPIMIFVNENGRGNRDTECVNGPQGAAASYLISDVVDWAERSLGVSTRPASWGAVGFSEGGTCALDLGLEDPGRFGAFVDVAGDAGPNLGGPEQTFERLYGGRVDVARSFDPADILADHRYHDLTGWLVVGDGDQDGRAAARSLTPGIVHSGIQLHMYNAAGGHTWAFARRSFARIYPALVATLDRAVGTSGSGSPLTPTDASTARLPLVPPARRAM